MATNWPPKKNVAFTMYFFVYKNDGTIIANPTLTGSNVHVDGNTTEVTNSTLAVVDATTGLCSIALAQATMNGDQIDGTITSSSTGAVVYTFKLMTAANTQDEIGADVAAAHAHAQTIDGHITADYGATEKTAIDLLDDANGLVNIHDTVDTLATATNLAAAKTVIDNIHDIDLPAVKLDTAAVKVQTDKLAFTTANKVDARAFTVDDKTGYSGTATNMVAAAPDAAAVNAACDTAIADAALATAANLAAVKTVVDDIPTNAELATALGTADDATLAAIAALDVKVGTPEDTDIATELHHVHAHTAEWVDGGRLDLLLDAAASGGGLDAAGVRTAIGLATANLDTQLAGLPTDADVNAACDTAISDAALATAANLATVDSNVDAVLADTNELQATWSWETGGYQSEMLASVNLLAIDNHDAVFNPATDAPYCPELAASLAAVKEKTDGLPVDPAAESLLEAAIAAATPTIDFTAVLEAIADLGESGVSIDLTPLTDAVELVQAALGAASVTVQSPVAASGAVTIYAGDDYDADHGRQVAFVVADASHALGLDAAQDVVRFKCSQAAWTASTVTSTADGYTVTFEPTATQTAALTIARQAYELEATLADGDVCTLATGTLVVRKNIPAVS
jgi:hypothetical protein